MDESTRELFDAAVAVRERSYSPYSNFKVGAAIRTADGSVFAACNVENAAYPEGVCAEGGAISMMVAGTDGVPTIIDVVVVADAEVPATPCGGCRQKINEFADASTRIRSLTLDGAGFEAAPGDLLPRSFGPDDLL